MGDSIDKNLKRIHYLASQISQGWHYLHVAKYLKDAYRDNKIKGAHTLLTNAQSACWDSSVLALANVVVDNDDSLNINYLFNCLERDPSSYPYICKCKLRKQIKKHRDQLKQVDAILPRLKERRSKIIAHLDRKLVNQPETVFSYPQLDMESLIQAFLVLREILGVYDKQTESSSLWLDDSGEIYRDIHYLIALIDKDRAVNSTQ